MIGADGVRLALFIVAPLWIDWMPGTALTWLLVTVFVTGVAERLWTVAKDGAAPALLPAPPPEGAAVRPLPDHLDALRRLYLRTGFVALPLAAAALVVVTLVSNLLGTGIDWFDAAPGGARPPTSPPGCSPPRVAVLYFLELPDAQRRARAPRWRGCAGPRAATGAEQGPHRARFRCSCSPAPRSPAPSPPPSPSPCCTPPTWAAARPPSGCWSSR